MAHVALGAAAWTAVLQILTCFNCECYGPLSDEEAVLPEARAR